MCDYDIEPAQAPGERCMQAPQHGIKECATFSLISMTAFLNVYQAFGPAIHIGLH